MVKKSPPGTTIDIVEEVDRSKVLQKMRPEKKEPNLQGSDLNEWRKMQLNPDLTSKGIYRTIGARNPYALAERIENAGPIAWSTTDFMANREKLVQILRKLPSFRKIQYKELFNFGHMHQSPLYSRIFIKNFSEKFIETSKNNPEEPGQPPAPEEKPCSNTGDYWDVYCIPGTTTPAPYCKVGRIPTKSEVIEDAVQGCAYDCYFIAALCSVAFLNYPICPVFAKIPLKDTYEIKFYYHDGTERPVTVTHDIVLESTGKSPVFARPSTSNEVWAAIYEKAYGEFMLLHPMSTLDYRGDPVYKNLPRPDIPKFQGGNPLESLVHLTGLKYTLNSTYFNTKDIPNQSFAKISNAIYSTDGINGITKYPMVAWTYLNAAEANAAHPDDPPISYNSEVFVANHSYSILGTIKTNKNYVVLRNPYGRLWGADPNDTDLYTGTWSPPDFKTLTLSLDDGIFALEAGNGETHGRFERYFTAFGWVQ